MPVIRSANHPRKDTINKLTAVMQYLQPFFHGFLLPLFFLLIFQVYRTNLMSFIKFLQIIVRIPLIIDRLVIRRIWKKTELPSYHFKEAITSTTTQIFFGHSKLTGIDICMKVWPKRKIEDCSSEDPTNQLKNLIEGFMFNQRFAPGVYLGVAPITTPDEGAQEILRGDLIFKPNINNLKPGKYVIVMRNIQKKWRLDHRLSSKRDNLRTRKGMEFLARKVARMHKQLELLPRGEIRSDIVASKISFNIMRLGQAIHLLADADMEEKYAYICKVMNAAYDNYATFFDQRSREGHVKRCHGDLKTTNLWVSPWKILPRKLFALDCIDFNPDFCLIDTLSDVAMLAQDIQQVISTSGENDAEDLVMHFLEAYCEEMQEDDVRVLPLLRYYMTEKAIVCSYVSILLDGSLKLGKRYFFIAYLLAQHLEQLHVPATPTSPAKHELAIRI